MSPLEIEAYRNIGIKVTGGNLENKPILKTNKRVEKELPSLPGGFTQLLRGEKAVIPDVPGVVIVENNNQYFTIIKESHPNGLSDPIGDTVRIIVEVKRHGVTSGEEEPSISKEYRGSAMSFRGRPRIIWSGNEGLAKVSWRKE